MLWDIFRYELGYKLRRVSTWLFFAVLLGLSFQVATQGYVANARNGGYSFNGPFVIAAVTLLGSLMGLLVAASLAGDAAARDVQTRMHPLVYTTRVGKAGYLGGRFLAAFVLQALLLVAVPVGLLLALLTPGLEPELLGPFRPAAYLSAYFILALPNAFVATALLFSMAALGRREMASYLGGVLLFLAAMVSWQFVAGELGRWELAKLMDPLGLTVMSALSKSWTPLQKSTQLIGLEGALLSNRLLWLGLALGGLALTWLRFRFVHPMAGARSGSGARRRDADVPRSEGVVKAVPRVARTFGLATHVRQTLAIAGESFRQLMTGGGGLALGAMAVLLVLTGPELMEYLGVPLFPTTGHLTRVLVRSRDLPWQLVPLLILFFAGELVWRERDARLGDIADAMPVPDWVPFVGKLLGLGLMLVVAQALMMAAAMLVQVRLDYPVLEVGLYARILFGLQLAGYLLFALLALVVHVVVNHKYVGHMVVLLAYGCMNYAPALGLEHNLLVYGADPGWAYSDMRGFGPFLGPWLWFKLYWSAWALLLSLVARLLWVRGRERGIGSRLQLARRRWTRPVAGAAAVAVGLLLTVGGFILYNTNVLNAYHTTSDRAGRRAEYERRYGRYAGLAQPVLTGTRLHVEFHPSRRTAELRGTYELVNRSAVAIDFLHLATASEVETDAVRFNRPATLLLADEELGHRSYALEAPLQPGESLRLDFEVRFQPRGFSNQGIDASVVTNGSYFQHREWLPAIGYQEDRELSGGGERRAHGLTPRPAFRSLSDVEASQGVNGVRMAFEAVVGTEEGQVAVAPGSLRRTWTENGRRYFHYATDFPIRDDYAFFSADYAVHDATWNDVAIQIFHHPGHAWNLDGMVRSVQASLDYCTEQFGPYPHKQLRLVEHPGDGNGLHASPMNISYEEGFSLFNPKADGRELDFPFAIVAHEVAHQWWGNQLTPARVEGAPVLTESLAWYSALAVVKKTYGDEHLRRLLGVLREAYLTPRALADVPLLRATDWFLAYRKGPFVMHALREYIGEARVNTALRRLLEQYGSGTPPLPTSLDLYRELQAVTPDGLGSLLHDLFETNTYWELEAKQATDEPAEGGTWRVTLDVRARKVVVDTEGVVTEVPMDDLVEVGVFAAEEDGAAGEPLYLHRHRIHSGEQRITVTVSREPARAGIDPRILLLDVKAEDNLAKVTRGE
ncbi:M1 family aminopeptidase [Archangium sp.]|uniref:ABC transporter permease/M1 family aminopeptidase n=1 Tax=Archangium sp. TaxID=1872627 RepID=UPI00286B26CD|nr:M1 family aminopeptidase [Archangium sp.]